MRGWRRKQYGPVSLAVPPGLYENEDAPPGSLAALTAMAPATLSIRRIDTGGAATLAGVMSRLCGAAPRRVHAKGETHLWPGLVAEDPGQPRQIHYLFESGGEVFHGFAEAPPHLWADYGVFLEEVMHSLDLGQPPSPTLPLFPGEDLPEVAEAPPELSPVEAVRQRLAPVSAAAHALILARRFEEAEASLLAIDRDVQGAVALAAAYKAALIAAPSEALILERAVHWAHRAFPSAHTAMEAEDYSKAAGEEEARLRAIFRPAP